jgi:hypothetical protein
MSVAAPPVAPRGSTRPLRIEPADNSLRREHFIQVPDRLYAGQPTYVAPLHYDRRTTLDPEKNPYFRHAKAQLWVAYRGHEPVGRISAQVDPLYLARHDPTTGHFGFLDAADDEEVFRALTTAAEHWLRLQGMRRALGPFSLSINEECGLLAEGFDQRPVMMMPFHPPYAAAHLAGQGYVKAKDLLAYNLDLGRDLTAKAARMLDRAESIPRVTVRRLDKRRYTEDLTAILDIFNESWAANWGFVPLTQDVIDWAS